MTEEKKQTKEESTKTDDSGAKRKNVFEEFGDSVGRFATKTFESIKQTIDKSLDSRNTVLTIRVNEEANKKLNMLVETGIFKSRSESAAFLIEEGIKHQAGLFKKIAEKLEKIEKIKDELKDIITEEMSGKEKK
jgi:Arc/MetJ-type ribon-helix-helix transcriptional regulator